jgi:hypothetical protein
LEEHFASAFRVEVYRFSRFFLKMDIACSSEKSVSIYMTA